MVPPELMRHQNRRKERLWTRNRKAIGSSYKQSKHCKTVKWRQWFQNILL